MTDAALVAAWRRRCPAIPARHTTAREVWKGLGERGLRHIMDTIILEDYETLAAAAGTDPP